MSECHTHKRAPSVYCHLSLAVSYSNNLLQITQAMTTTTATVHDKAVPEEEAEQQQ